MDLAAALHDMKVLITGTIMRNRKGLPLQIKSVNKTKIAAKKILKNLKKCQQSN